MLETADSIASAVGATAESQEYIHARMAGLLGLPDVNDLKRRIEDAWKEAYALKVKTDDLNRRVFKQEALLTGIKAGNDLIRAKEESNKLEELKTELKNTNAAFDAASQKAKALQEELVEAQKSLKA